MKSWLLLLLAWIAALAATPANASMAFNVGSEAGHFIASRHDDKKPPANNQCQIGQRFLSGWLAAWRESAPGYSAGRTKNKTDCAGSDWLDAARSLLAIGRDLLLKSVWSISLNAR